MKKNVLVVSLAAIGLLAACSSVGPAKSEGAALGELGRQVLPADGGWAAAGAGTTGGAKASAENVLTVSSRKELVAALKKAGAEPKIIYVKGTINLSTDDSGRELTEKDFADPVYNFEAYKKAYDPTVWNRQELVKGKPPKLSGPQEEARRKSADKQFAHIVLQVPSNTSIIGVGKDAKIIKGSLYIDNGISNVIIRNIAFEDAFDLFPEWDPGDGYNIKRTEPVIVNGVNYTVDGCQEKFESDTKGPHRCNGGRWNSLYDMITLKGATNVWIDHCSFSDGERLDKQFPPVFGAPYNQPEQKVQHHDAAIDITKGSDFVTISNSRFFNHDKLSLVGGSDSDNGDEGKLSVSYVRNYFDGVGQRQPRVRFGKVHVANNLYTGERVGKQYSFMYGVGLGKNAKVLSQNNAYELQGDFAPAELISFFTAGSAMADSGTLLNGKPVDIVADFNAKNPKQQIGTISWTPATAMKLLPSAEVPAYVKANAGAGKL
ncbi:PbsX family transcriptional regulator [Uliginosibacterium sp. 31-16]|uniref:pectate lyase family protein n=1 Tax=Uliginosibacterium sp. 31-16 TaxID=3068315 RepID=UPI00273D03F0|nr:PbsX family transcriptional regulator [Uliginosibacterium sp. 31-16]MDP5240099.1 PbsX family transcriptional regulator [Uliginosibacterium sp. 31-16]